MKKKLQLIFSFVLVAAFCSVTLIAQTDRQTINAASSIYVVSAKAGGVNFVEGKVTVARKDAKSGLLLKGDELEIGDKIATGADGKAEILLNPGSYARLGGNSNFEFVTTSLDDLQLKLNSGSAMFEVITDAEFGFSVATPKAVFKIVKSGIYRVDVLSDGTGQLEVWKGKAEANGTPFKGGKKASVNGEETSVAKFDRDDKDALETWSRARAKELVKANAQLQNSYVRNSLISSFYGSGWSIADSYGLWVYNYAFGRYCFLPFGYGWNSPYGYYYRRDLWYYNLPPTIYYPPYQQPQNVVTPHGVGGSGVPAKVRSSQNTRETEPIRIQPPYVRVQKDIGSYPAVSDANGDFSPALSAPSRVSPTFPAPAPPPSSSTPTLAPPSKVQ